MLAELLAFIEAVVYERLQSGPRGVFVFTFDADVQNRAFGCRKHHDRHDTFTIDETFGVFAYSNVSGKLACARNKLCSGASVQTQFINDFNVCFDHGLALFLAR